VITKFIEVTNEVNGRPFNWGKFMVARFTPDEWSRGAVEGHPEFALLDQIGWSHKHVIVFDLQTCEGAAFYPGGWPKADVEKHKIWICPLFEPFLTWLYQQDLSDLNALPSSVVLADAPASLSGYRRGEERVFKVKYQRLGGHVHTSWFSARAPDATYAKLGDLTFDLEDWEVLRQWFPGREFIVEERGRE
jgi:hypothetical protein